MLDISGAALRARRSDSGAGYVDRGDVTGDWCAPPVDIWHDRAAFHFLTDAMDRARYVEHLITTLKPGRQAIIATFGLDGPPTCTGLHVMRYSAETLAAELGPTFRLVEILTNEHHTPTGGVTLCYNRFIRD